MTDDILKHFEEKFANLPEGTVLVPPTDDDDSDVRSVEFNDPELMSGKGDPKLTPTEVKTITQFISEYPYSMLTYLCRVRNIKPAEAVTKVMAFEPNNNWWDEDAFADALKQDADRLTAEEWEPGVTPSEPLTKAQAFVQFDAVVRVSLDAQWDVYDMAHRTGLDFETLGTYLVDYCISNLLSKYKYIGGERKWVFSPETIKRAAVNNSWCNGWPYETRPMTPYVHYCATCGTCFTDTEKVCLACGASRCLTPVHPFSIPGKVTPGNDLADFGEIANL